MERQLYYKTAPRVPSVQEVERLMLERRSGGHIPVKLSKKEKKALWMNRLIVSAVASIPLTIFFDELIYMIYPQLAVYSAPAQVQWVWAGVLFVFCLIGTFLARLAASIVNKGN
jgi:hypothetical protein